jgi:hypothetical protein
MGRNVLINDGHADVVGSGRACISRSGGIGGCLAGRVVRMRAGEPPGAKALAGIVRPVDQADRLYANRPMALPARWLLRCSDRPARTKSSTV